MRKLTKLLSALIVLVLATAFIGCGNPSSSSDGTSGGSGSCDGNSNSPTYTLTTGRLYFCSDRNTCYIFHDDNSVSWVEGSSTMKIEGRKWRVSGYTVETYDESSGRVFNTFTANPDFTQLTMTSHDNSVYNLQ
jgi:hypothetical protein